MEISTESRFPSSLWNNFLNRCAKSGNTWVICGKLPLCYLTTSPAFHSVTLSWLWYNFSTYYFYHLQSLFSADAFISEIWKKRNLKSKGCSFRRLINNACSLQEAQSISLPLNCNAFYLSPYLSLSHFWALYVVSNTCSFAWLAPGFNFF